MVIDLEGNWKSGKAFDLHTVASTHLGTDEFGHDRWETTRSEMGELVYQLKYRFDQAAVAKIIALLDKISGIEKFDFILPIPATNKTRPIKPCGTHRRRARHKTRRHGGDRRPYEQRQRRVERDH